VVRLPRRVILITIIWLIFLPAVTGCWSSRELNELYVILAIGIDKIDNQYEVSVQVADPSQMSRNRTADRTTTTVFTSRATTLFEAIRKMTTTSSRKMYGGHILFVLFDEETAKQGISAPLDFLVRESEIRPDFTFAIARDSSTKDILELITPTEILPAMDLYKSLGISEQVWAPTTSVRLKDLLQQLTKDGIQPALTGLTLIGDIQKGKTAENTKRQQPDGRYKYMGIGVFKNDQLMGWLNESDSKAYTYLTNGITSTVGAVKCPKSDQKFVIEVTKAKISRQPSIVNNAPHMKLDVHVDANIGEINCDHVNLNKQQDLGQLETIAGDTLKRILTHGIETLQNKYGSDILGFGEDFHRKYPRLWTKWKDNWDEEFTTLTYELNIDYKIHQYGKIGNPIQEKKE
jgi:spore germination protein KC